MLSSPDKNQKFEVPPRFELGSLDSESRVLTITPRDLVRVRWSQTPSTSKSKCFHPSARKLQSKKIKGRKKRLTNIEGEKRKKKKKEKKNCYLLLLYREGKGNFRNF